ncbi:MAG: ABC transporter ATP-binding protein [Deinococcaceae bacterium]
MTPVLEIRDVHHKHESTQVLSGLSLSVHAGEIVALLGPSGSGKSTLLHLAGGLELPTHGQILWKKTDITKLNLEQRTRLRSRELGVIFQHHYLLEDLTALENAQISSLIQRQPDNRARTLLERVGLSHRLTHFPKQLSGGERQRVALVRALSAKPALLLADEPTGSLDQSNSETVMDLLVELTQEAETGVLMVTHDTQLAHRAHRVLQLRDGILI